MISVAKSVARSVAKNVRNGALLNHFKSVTHFNMAIDGHSFIAPVGVIPPAYLSYTLPYAVNTVGEVYNGAIGGTNLDHLLENASTVDALLIEENSTTANVLVIYSLNVSAEEGKGLEQYNQYKPYLTARAAAGWKVFVFTLTSSLQSLQPDGWIAQKEIFNDLLRNDLTLTKNCFVVDTDLDSRLDDRTNTSVYYDGIHPSELGGQYLLDLLLNKMQDVFSDKIIPNFQVPENNTIFYLNPDTFTVVGSKISEWADFFESGIKITQSNDANRPTKVGDVAQFDGINDVLASSAFTWNQPATIYLLMRQLSWTITDNIFAGINANSGTLYQSTVSPSMRMYAGANESSNNINLPIETWGIVKVIFDGANSKIKIDRTNTLSVNAGTANMGGFTLANLPGYSRNANIEVKAIVARTVSDFRQKDEYVIYKALEKLLPV